MFSRVCVCVCVCVSWRWQERRATRWDSGHETTERNKVLNTEVKGQLCESHDWNQETEKWCECSCFLGLHSRAETEPLRLQRPDDDRNPSGTWVSTHCEHSAHRCWRWRCGSLLCYCQSAGWCVTDFTSRFESRQSDSEPEPELMLIDALGPLSRDVLMILDQFSSVHPIHFFLLSLCSPHFHPAPCPHSIDQSNQAITSCLYCYCVSRVDSRVQDCENGISMDLFLHVSLIPAVSCPSI